MKPFFHPSNPGTSWGTVTLDTRTPQPAPEGQPALKVFLRLVGLLEPHAGRFLLLFMLVVVSSLLNLLPPFLMRVAIDDYIVNLDARGVLLISGGIIIFGVVEGVVGFLQRYTSEYVGQNVIKDVRVRVYAHLSKQSFSFFDTERTGDLIARVISDTRQLRGFMSHGLVNVISNLVLLGGVLVVLLSWNALIGFMLLALVPFLIVGMVTFSRKVRPANKFIRAANGALSTSIQECLNGIREVKLYGREEYMINVFDTWNRNFRDGNVQATRTSATWQPYIPFVVSTCSAFMLLAGGLLAIDGTVSIGTVLAGTAYIVMLSRPVQMIIRFLELFSNARVAAERVFTILDRSPDTRDAPGAGALENVRGGVEYRDVHFSYGDGPEIIAGVSLDIPAGHVVAVVGPSGVGKTTLLHLLPRFYEITSGRVFVDGRDIRTVPLDDLRRNIGIVMQDTFLFDGSIKDNITFGNPDASMDRVKEAARIARLDAFIESLPLRYNTPIGERGVRLSGGQAQRLSIARVLLTDPRILILDEPTANVDAVTDHEVMAAIRHVMKGRTTLVIAHRLWTVKNADLIVVLKDGRVEATGSHAELVASSPFYRTFFASQFQQEDGGRGGGGS